ncbi:MAG: hypothetical protein QNK35_14165 [Bacteroides sp.]|nr:hypothetical protein [Bacteroides sp.]
MSRAQDLILEAMSRGFHFKGKDEYGRMLPKDEKFHKSWDRKPVEVLKDICGFQNKEEIVKIKKVISNIFTPPIS